MLLQQFRIGFGTESPGALLRALRDYLIGTGRQRPVRDCDGLATFIAARSSHVAQTSLYGYLRTRAGTMYPELFSNDDFMVSINIAKWQMWLACLSDLSVYCGGMLARRSPATEQDRIHDIVAYAVGTALAEAGEPQEAGAAFPENAASVRARIDSVDWRVVEDGESHFTCSPEALVTWAPIVEGLKELDRDIVVNSVRFRWQEVRRDVRRLLDADAVIASEPAGTPGPVQPDR